jgi:hypothetical protein
LRVKDTLRAAWGGGICQVNYRTGKEGGRKRKEGREGRKKENKETMDGRKGGRNKD